MPARRRRLDGELLRAALAGGVTFAAGEHFYADGAGRDEIRLCFTADPPDRIEEGVRRLAAALRGVRHRPAAAVDSAVAARSRAFAGEPGVEVAGLSRSPVLMEVDELMGCSGSGRSAGFQPASSA